MRWLKRLAVSGGLVTFGAAAGALGTAYGYQRVLVRASSDGASQQAGITAKVLSDLRLGNQDIAIQYIEGQLDGNLSGVRSWEQVTGKPPSADAVRWLSLAKVYRTAYASQSPPESGITDLLNEIPMPAPNTDCQWGVCRLQLKMLHDHATTVTQ